MSVKQLTLNTRLLGAIVGYKLLTQQLTTNNQPHHDESEHLKNKFSLEPVPEKNIMSSCIRSISAKAAGPEYPQDI